ncbi:acetyl-CoA carboxylase carboxyltransferase subunit beta [Candidatus Ozemobacteraceae bacterium]|nr:acetyl-CoA carboxylase carboxyltransferase subunit beta [Candidatus Ozemobacteraceae bacterium]OQA06302.1 MAG: Acetyl-coenzyme A carboxylase carboxyl transferase subunit beta [bacterium ADurb.Bin374]
MNFLERLIGPRKSEVPSELWEKCPSCGAVLITKDLARGLYICSKCDHHLRMPIWDRIALLTDGSSFVETDHEIESVDPLAFIDTAPYPDRLEKAFKKTDSFDAVTIGEGRLDGRPVLLGVMDFEFMGGSMGSVVGEKITRLLEKAAQTRIPAIVVSASGGARMQEGIFSLMQMAKTSAAVARMNAANVPYISVLTDPTTGGVSASFASLGDINIAEPGALIGFAGPRVIEQTIRQKLPDGFQRSEFLLSHGMIDMVVHRRAMKQAISRFLNIVLGPVEVQHGA